MANTGNVLPGTGASVTRGQTPWTSPGNITADDAADAGCVGVTGSDYLVGHNFNFASIPDGAQIVGILVRVEASEHSGGTEPLLAQLQNETGALFGTGKTNTNEGNLSGTAKAVYTFGSIADLWGAALTAAIVKDPDFGVRLWFATAHTVNIDYVTMAVEYSTAQTATAALATATASPQASAVTLGGVTGTTSLVTASASALDAEASSAGGAQTATAAEATATATIAAPGVTLGGLTATASEATATGAAQDSDVTLGGVTRTAAAVASTASAQPASIAFTGQLAVPISVVTLDNWTDEGGGVTDLHTHMDEGIAWNDADYVRSPAAPTEANEFVVALTALGLPQAGTVGVVVRAGTI